MQADAGINYCAVSLPHAEEEMILAKTNLVAINS